MTDRLQTPSTRRRFLHDSAAALAGAAALQHQLATGAYASANETLRIGLVGCGGRGTGAAAQALRADPHTQLIAVADAFADQIEGSLKSLEQTDVADRVMVPTEHRFVGFDAYQQLIATDVDIVLLATPPHFRPMHLRACIEAGKHVFAEKPVAVDAPGIRSVLETTRLARERDLSIVSGLCWRYETGMREIISRIHDGAIGEVRALESVRYSGGVGKLARRQPNWTEMEYEMRNWYYFTWLSGDFNTEQFVHELDKQSWVLGDTYPVRCVSTGGRLTRTGPEYGNIYDHFATIYEYANGVRYTATTRHQPGCSNPFHDLVIGTKGQANLMKFSITGENPWQGPRRRTNMHQLEHDAMYAALRKGEIINNGEYMAKSTMMAIMARMSAYTGQELTWEQAMNSQEDLSPPSYTWDAPIEHPQVALPGATKFV